ncbi:hypothetical protein V8C26DRAFT_410798 [Trichoderma gracile]
MSRSPIPPTLPLLAMLALITRWSMFALSCPISMIHDPLPVPRLGLSVQRHPQAFRALALQGHSLLGRNPTRPSTHRLPSSKHERQTCSEAS